MKLKNATFPNKLLISVVALFALYLFSVKASGIVLTGEKGSLLNEVDHDPTHVINTIESKLLNASLPTHDQAQYQFILSKAYYATFLGVDALSAAKKAVNLAEQSDDKLLEHASNISVARAYDTMADPFPGIEYAERALDWAKVHEQLDLQTEAMIAIGSIYVTGGKLVEALDFFTVAYRIAQANKLDSAGSAAPHVAAFIALVYEEQKQPELAIPYYKESVSYYRQTYNRVGLSNALYGLGLAQGRLGRLNKAVDNLNESLDLSIQMGDQQGAAFTIQALIELLFLTNRESHAEQLREFLPRLDLAIKIFADSGNRHMQARALLIKAEWYESNKLITDALEIAEQAEKIINRNNLDVQKFSLLALKARLYAAADNYQQAYKILQTLRLDELKKRKAVDEDKFQQLRADFELDQKEYENRLLLEKNARQAAELRLKEHGQTITTLIIVLLVIMFVSVVSMYIGSKRQHRKLERLAQTDELTGLFNRRQALISLDREMQLAVRHKHPLSVAVADLDDFKNINDTYGHYTGDEVLKHVSSVMKICFRNTDIIGRIGGEEFLFIFPASECSDVASSVRKFMNECKSLPASLNKHTDIKISFSIGLVSAQADDSVMDVLARADQLMYRAKGNGKDQVASEFSRIPHYS